MYTEDVYKRQGYHLTKFKELMGGQFASNEKVTIVGLKLRAIENVRVLGPVSYTHLDVYKRQVSGLN